MTCCCSLVLFRLHVFCVYHIFYICIYIAVIALLFLFFFAVAILVLVLGSAMAVAFADVVCLLLDVVAVAAVWCVC